MRLGRDGRYFLPAEKHPEPEGGAGGGLDRRGRPRLELLARPAVLEKAEIMPPPRFADLGSGIEFGPWREVASSSSFGGVWPGAVGCGKTPDGAESTNGREGGDMRCGHSSGVVRVPATLNHESRNASMDKGAVVATTI